MALKPYYQDDLTTIYHGDARKILPELSGVDVVITDPPYFGAIDPENTKAGVQAEYQANTAVGLYLASQMAPAVVVITSPSAHAITKVIREPPFVETFRWDCQEELVAIHTFGERRIGTWNGLVGGPRIPIPMLVTKQLYEPFAPGVLLDPFMGSGTTLMAAKSFGAKSIGIEISEERCEGAVDALRRTEPGSDQDSSPRG